MGRYEASAEVDRADAPFGETFRLSLRVAGEGNFPLLSPPRLALLGFHVFGVRTEPDGDGRRFVYDVALTDASLRAVPPIPFAFFDPSPPVAYRVVRTAEIPLRPRSSLPAGEIRHEEVGHDGGTLLWILLGASAVAVIAIACAVRRRAASARLPSPPD